MKLQRLARHAWAAAALLLAAGPRLTGAVYNNSVFNKGNYYPVPWWAVASSDVPAIASNALILRQNTITPNEFAQNVVLGIANNQRNDVAKAIGYMINANSTVGGGCPVPPPPTPDLARFGTAFATAILEADNQTALFGGQSLAHVAATQKSPNITVASLKSVNGFIVADTLIGGLFIAGKSCGPPDALTASTQDAVIAKYLNATCFYIGPLIRQLTLNNTRNIPAWNRTFQYDIALSNVSDPYVSGPTLIAYQECVSGPLSLQAVPSWLYYSFGPVVSIDSSDNSGGSTSSDSTSSDDGGVSLLAGSSLGTTGEVTPSSVVAGRRL